MTQLPIKIAKRISETCGYSGCDDKAIDGSDFCAPHDAHERGRDAGKKRRRRQRRADAGLCGSCGERRVPKKRRPDGTIIPRECAPCRKEHQERSRNARKKACVPDAARAVPGDEAISGSGEGSDDARWKVETGTNFRGVGTYQTQRYVGKGRRGRLTNEEQLAELRRDLLFAREKLDETIRALPILSSSDVLELGPLQRAAARREVASPAEQASRMIDDVVERLTGS